MKSKFAPEPVFAWGFDHKFRRRGSKVLQKRMRYFSVIAMVLGAVNLIAGLIFTEKMTFGVTVPLTYTTYIRFLCVVMSFNGLTLFTSGIICFLDAKHQQNLFLLGCGLILCYCMSTTCGGPSWAMSIMLTYKSYNEGLGTKLCYILTRDNNVDEMLNIGYQFQCSGVFYPEDIEIYEETKENRKSLFDIQKWERYNDCNCLTITDKCAYHINNLQDIRTNGCLKTISKFFTYVCNVLSGVSLTTFVICFIGIFFLKKQVQQDYIDDVNQELEWIRINYLLQQESYATQSSRM